MSDYGDIIGVAPVPELKKYPVLTRGVSRGDPLIIAVAQSEIATKRIDRCIRDMQYTINNIRSRQNAARLQENRRKHQAGCKRVWLSRIRRLPRACAGPQAACVLGAVHNRVLDCWQRGCRFIAGLIAR